MTGVVEGGGQISTECTSFDVFFRATYRRMRARALLLAWDPSEAEDAVQEAYLELLRSWDRVSLYESPEAWVYKIMAQRLSKARKNWFRRQQLTIEPAAAASVEETVGARQTLAAVRILREREQQVVVRCCLEGRTQQQVADELGLKRATVAVHLRNARIKLARALGLDLTDDTVGGDALLPASADGHTARRTPHEGDSVLTLLRHAEAWLADARWGENGENPDEDRVLADLRARLAAGDR